LFAAVLAAGTKSAKGDGVIIKLKTRRMVFRKIRQLETRNGQVCYFTTLNAAYMMVAAGVGVEACFGLRAAYLDHQAYPDKCFKDSIDCRSRQPLNIFFEIIKELVGRRVVCTTAQGMEQRSPLVGQAESSSAADGFHLLDFFAIEFLIRRLHGWKYIANGNLCQLVFEYLFLEI
jgi:hypothetical protein